MKNAKDIPVEHFIFATLVLLLFSWFTISALLHDQIRMGRHGSAKVLTREAQPTVYWTSVGGFATITTFGWFAVVFNVLRKIKQSREVTRTKPCM